MRRRSADFRQYHKRCTRFTQTLHKGAPYPRRGDSPSADGGNVAAPAAGDDAVPTAGAKRKDNLRFSFLFGLLPFPWIAWRRLPTCDRCEIRETAEDFFFRRGAQCAPMSRHIRSVGYRTATQVGYFQQARHDSAAQLVSLKFADSTYELGVWYNLSSQKLSVTTR